MIQDLDQLKDNWRRMNIRADKLEADNRRLATELAARRASSAKERLARSYRRMALFALLLPVLAPMIVLVMDLSFWLAVVYAGFGLIMAAADLWFAKKIAQSDYLSLPVVESLSDAIEIRRRQRILRTVSMTMGLMVVAAMFSEALVAAPDSVLIGMGIGLVIGLIGGLIKYRQLSKLAKQIQKELRDITEPEE